LAFGLTYTNAAANILSRILARANASQPVGYTFPIVDKIVSE